MNVEVIMSTGGRSISYLENVLRSWSRVTYKGLKFSLIDNGSQNEDEIRELAYNYNVVTRHKRNNELMMPNAVWRQEGMASKADYIIYAMSDELLGDYSLIEKMLEIPKDERSSVLTYYLNEGETSLLDTIDWLDNPKLIEELPWFWEHTAVDDAQNKFRLSAGLTTHITGATRDYWEWLGWHRDDEFGYLNMDTDIVLREQKLGKKVNTVGVCYHQWHPRSNIPEVHRLPAYVYETDEQARLLSPARRGQ